MRKESALDNTEELLPNVDKNCFSDIRATNLVGASGLTHPPRILLLYGSVRKRSFSRLLTLEAERLLQRFGAETRVFHADGLPLPDSTDNQHPKVRELLDLATWCEGMV